MSNRIKIYLDDLRSPVDKSWRVVRNYDAFCKLVTEIGFENIDCISLDHDLGDTAMKEYYNNVHSNYTLNYENITEKTGLDCAKWLIEQWLNGKPLIDVYVHSANPVGSANIMGWINNYRMNVHKPQNCIRIKIKHTV